MSAFIVDTVSSNVVISTCARAKDADRAEGWLKKLLERKGAMGADVVSFCMTIDACVRSGDVLRSEQWHLKTDRFGLRPTFTCCGTLVHAFARLSDITRAEAVIERMRATRFEVDTTILQHSDQRLLEVC